MANAAPQPGDPSCRRAAPNSPTRQETMRTTASRLGKGLGWLLGAVAVGGLATVFFLPGRDSAPPPPSAPPSTPPPPPAPEPPELVARVHEFCGHCHRYPPPDTFPRDAWNREVHRGYDFYRRSGLLLSPPPPQQVVSYYEARAPRELSRNTFPAPAAPPAARFDRVGYPSASRQDAPLISNVSIAFLTGSSRPEVIACDMRHGEVSALRPSDPSPFWRTLGKASHPAHAEIVDLDGDGVKDLLVADLGNVEPTDKRCGSVVWLRGARDGTFTAHTLLKDVGRVADVRAADFRGVGKPDLVVAVFGWQQTGEILYLENRTTDWDHPQFAPRVLDPRHGTIHVPVADLNGDGRPDFVALISQEHESIVAFLNEGDGRFTPKTLYAGDHPALGSSGIDLVDLDGDGDLDILYTNGDVLDRPYLLKPYHGVQWLENKGGLRFEPHHLTSMYGVHRAIAADFSGRGLRDVFAVSFLPPEGFPRRAEDGLDAVVLLEQVAPGKFVRHSLESGTCDHVSCVAGDLYGTGRPDVAVGNFGGVGPPVTVWRNLGRAGGAPRAPGPAPGGDRPPTP